MVGSLVLLAPYCLAAGALLTLGCRTAASGGRLGGVGPVYLADAAGSVAGGVLFVFVLVQRSIIRPPLLPAFLNLALAALLARRIGARWFTRRMRDPRLRPRAAGALGDADSATTAWQHRGEKVLSRANSPYGRLIVCDSSGLLTFYENGIPVAATENTSQVEEAVHYAMCQRPAASRVLLIGGGVAGDAREILRYPAVDEVTYVELDPAIIEAGRRLVPANLDDSRITIAAADGRRFVQESRGSFDVIIVDLPDPSTSLINRYYTAGFFAEAHRALRPGGVLAFGLGHYENFVGPELARLLASARRTLGGAFRQVIMVPGGRVFFLGSDEALTLEIAGRLESVGIHPRMVNRHYLQAMLSPDRLADIDRAVARPAALNTDANPVLYYYELRRWLSQFGGISAVLIGVLALALASYLVRVGPVPRVIFAAGFAASGLEIVLLLAFQMLYGSLYRQVGLVVSVFMAGLAAGAWTAARGEPGPFPTRRLAAAGLAIAVLAAAIPLGNSCLRNHGLSGPCRVPGPGLHPACDISPGVPCRRTVSPGCSRRGPGNSIGSGPPLQRGSCRSRPRRIPRQLASGSPDRRDRRLPAHRRVERRRRGVSLEGQAMSAVNILCLKLVRWTGWLLLPVVLAFFATGYAMSNRYGFGILANERTALAAHKWMHAPLGILVVAHVVPSLYLAMIRWGWIKQR